MGRGKLEIKRIENTTNRQVTFSKRRNGIMKKAQELTVLCDAKISLIIVSSSSTKRVYHYISPGVSLKKMYDEYQKVEGVDLWRKHYEQMQEQERKLLDINTELRREISRRMGGDLEELSIGELGALQQQMSDARLVIRDRKYHVIKNQTGTTRKKVRSLEEIRDNLLLNLETRFKAPEFGLEDDNNQGVYEDAANYANNGAAANLFGVSRHSRHHNFQQAQAGCYSINFQDLRLA
ncbi:hypothetical protein BVRB_6g129710 [Beta vulgaris subsp. vulgaris]|nr:hypothetical protein BVRB_6g129710 [Beta vulgaris subsp. vulgaris]